MNILYISLGYPGVGLLGCMVATHLAFEGTAKSFSRVNVPLYILTKGV